MLSTSNLPLAIPPLVFLGMLRLWRARGRDPRAGADRHALRAAGRDDAGGARHAHRRQAGHARHHRDASSISPSAASCTSRRSDERAVSSACSRARTTRSSCESRATEWKRAAAARADLLEADVRRTVPGRPSALSGPRRTSSTSICPGCGIDLREPGAARLLLRGVPIGCARSSTSSAASSASRLRSCAAATWWRTLGMQPMRRHRRGHRLRAIIVAASAGSCRRARSAARASWKGARLPGVPVARRGRPHGPDDQDAGDVREVPAVRDGARRRGQLGEGVRGHLQGAARWYTVRPLTGSARRAHQQPRPDVDRGGHGDGVGAAEQRRIRLQRRRRAGAASAAAEAAGSEGL